MGHGEHRDREPHGWVADHALVVVRIQTGADPWYLMGMRNGSHTTFTRLRSH
jgi:hypothetical protein